MKHSWIYRLLYAKVSECILVRLWWPWLLFFARISNKWQNIHNHNWHTAPLVVGNVFKRLFSEFNTTTIIIVTFTLVHIFQDLNFIRRAFTLLDILILSLDSAPRFYFFCIHRLQMLHVLLQCIIIIISFHFTLSRQFSHLVLFCFILLHSIRG